MKLNFIILDNLPNQSLPLNGVLPRVKQERGSEVAQGCWSESRDINVLHRRKRHFFGAAVPIVCDKHSIDENGSTFDAWLLQGSISGAMKLHPNDS
jgi:hypothetical protein